ncbi:retrovirus-related pol polyprotein from transposon TNT 1-94 [Tanacetum coccineum]
MALAVQNRTKIKNESLSCTHCYKAGHTEETCFEINGYPEWWGEIPRVDRKGGSYEKGTTTRRVKGKGSHGSTQANTVQAGGGIGANTGTSDSNFIPLPGASHHMTRMIEELFNLNEIVKCPLELPDGNIAMAKKKGDVRFDNGFILKNVLYVPGLTCNLLFVPQLLDEGNCIVQFVPNICVIQDLTSKMVISAGERRDGGLLHFREVPTTRVFKTTTTTSIPFEIWHKRLGHPSLEVLKFIIQVNINKRDREFSQNCDVCHRAKQCQEKFPSSDNKATSTYELIYCDLWGPYKTVSSCGASYFLTIVDDLSRSVWAYL